jgi:multiple sugar transport system permease protein
MASTQVSIAKGGSRRRGRWPGKRTRRVLPRRVFVYACVTLIVLWTLLPFSYLLLSSVKTNLEIAAFPPVWFPKKLHLTGYRDILLGTGNLDSPAGRFRACLRNSVLIASCTTVLCVVLGSLGGYALQRLKFRGRNTVGSGILIVQMFPFIAMLIPLYILITKLGLRDTIWSLVFVHSAYIAPYATWIMRSFFCAVPTELEDAALIDGTSRLGALFRVIMPLAAPGMAAVAVVAFLMSWNDFLAGLVFTTTTKAMPVTVVMAQFGSQTGADLGLMATGVVLGMGPPIVLALLFQRFLISGLVAGAVKG